MNARAARLARTPRRWPLALAAGLLTLAAAVALGEWFGWPFLAVPVQRWLSQQLDRRVVISDGGGLDTDRDAVHDDDFRVRFLGGLRLHATQLEIAAPDWSRAPHLLQARDVDLALGYADLWRAHRGGRLHIRSLQARTLDVHLERQADGRASWQFGAPSSADAPAPPLPQWGRLQVDSGLLNYRDLPLAIDVQAAVSLQGAAASASAVAGQRLQVSARGHWRKLPLKIEAQALGVLPWAAGDVPTEPVPVMLEASVGRAHLSFLGTTTYATRLADLAGRYSLSGPSLAAVGDAVGVTLPSTAAFRMDGLVRKQGPIWRTVIGNASVGASRLNGAFVYEGEEAGRSVPLLSGRLGGTRLMLVDLGPVVGTTAAVPAAEVGTTLVVEAGRSKAPGKVLPDRPFDLPSLRAMDANVLIDIATVDLNTRYLAPLQPLRSHLQLVGGVLSLRQLDARAAQGQLQGDVVLDGRGSPALWTADLRWDGVRLERWIRQTRADAAPAYVSGRLSGRATLAGQGRSTAEILAGLKGQVRSELRDGSVSHLAIEVAGLDLAQGLGVFIKGDDALPVHCAAADLVAERGVLRTRVLVLDTTDSTVWVEGSVSLAAETIDLRAIVSPKDRSPLALRTPLRVRGSFADPQVSLEKGSLGAKVAAALMLALVNPLAALIPLLDPGNAEEAGRGAAGCQALMQRRPAPRAAAPAAR